MLKKPASFFIQVIWEACALCTVTGGAYGENEYYRSVFLISSQAFIRAWHQKSIYKMSGLLPERNLECHIMELFRSFNQSRLGSNSDYFFICPIRLILKVTSLATFAGDIVVIATDASQSKAMEKPRNAFNKIERQTRDWKI